MTDIEKSLIRALTTADAAYKDKTLTLEQYKHAVESAYAMARRALLKRDGESIR